MIVTKLKKPFFFRATLVASRSDDGIREIVDIDHFVLAQDDAAFDNVLKLA